MPAGRATLQIGWMRCWMRYLQRTMKPYRWTDIRQLEADAEAGWESSKMESSLQQLLRTTTTGVLCQKGS